MLPTSMATIGNPSQALARQTKLPRIFDRLLKKHVNVRLPKHFSPGCSLSQMEGPNPNPKKGLRSEIKDSMEKRFI